MAHQAKRTAAREVRNHLLELTERMAKEAEKAAEKDTMK